MDSGIVIVPEEEEEEEEERAEEDDADWSGKSAAIGLGTPNAAAEDHSPKNPNRFKQPLLAPPSFPSAFIQRLKLLRQSLNNLETMLNTAPNNNETFQSATQNDGSSASSELTQVW